MNCRIPTLLGMLMTIVIGLASRKVARFTGLSGLLYVGDALWSVLVYQCILFLKPQVAEKRAAIICLGISYLVEASQLIQQKDLDLFRQTQIGRWMLGNGYDFLDLIAYTAGVVVFYQVRILMKGPQKQAE